MNAKKQVTWPDHNIDISVGKLFVMEERFARLEMALDSIL